MSDAKRVELKTPVVVICYGRVRPDNQRLFAISSDGGSYVLPIFTDMKRAERFLAYHNKRLLAETLPISIVGAVGGDSEEVLPEQLALYVVERPEFLTDMLSMVHVAVRMAYITLDPEPDSNMLCYELDELSVSGSNDLKSSPGSS